MMENFKKVSETEEVSVVITADSRPSKIKCTLNRRFERQGQRYLVRIYNYLGHSMLFPGE